MLIDDPARLVGITPAHAGKRKSKMTISIQKQDHPRTRGEKMASNTYEAVGNRITPAHAGKSLQWVEAMCFVKDHPRTRGEKSASILTAGLVIGSPPHTRGKAEWRQKRIPQTGITPAHAGKSVNMYRRKRKE